jgi:putative tryptophan/tyrosine transport system substrate-binding protein
MRRREFIAGLGGAVAWSIAAWAQQDQPMRRLGILWPFAENDPLRRGWTAAFAEGLHELGWTEGHNLRIDTRWNPGTAEQARMVAKELVDLRPDVLVTGTGRLVRVVQQETHVIPIVLAGAGDPLALGLVKSIAHPEGNTTGITDIFPSNAGKWLELLKQSAPGLTQVALIWNPDSLSSIEYFDTPMAQAASQYGIKSVSVPVSNAGEIENAIATFASAPDGGLIIAPPSFSSVEREVINRLAVRYRLPVIYQDRSFAIEGGLLSYGADFIDIFRHGAPPYVDRILRGARPGDLSVQFPTKFTLVVNLKTAKAMSLLIPESFLLRAEEVIE